MTAVETHWDIAIETDVPGQLTPRCGCGWSQVVAGQGVAAILEARQLWDDHDCEGRGLQLVLDAFPGSVVTDE